MTTKIKGARAVVETRRKLTPGCLQFFPTPPWGTRALCEIVLPQIGETLLARSVWEPAAGEGHMAFVLQEYAGSVVHSDVHDYGVGSLIGSFVGEGFDVIGAGGRAEIPAADWIITNPPFPLAEAFILRALKEAAIGVAMLCRSNFRESIGRYECIFKPHPPTLIAQFVERLPMHEGHWDPDGDTMTSYSWFVWLRGRSGPTIDFWIPPGQREALECPGDRARFGMKVEGGLL